MRLERAACEDGGGDDVTGREQNIGLIEQFPQCLGTDGVKDGAKPSLRGELGRGSKNGEARVNFDSICQTGRPLQHQRARALPSREERMMARKRGLDRGIRLREEVVDLLAVV